MFILTKSVLALILGFVITVAFGYFFIPVLKKLKAGQKVSSYLGESHKLKDGIPTLGGLIFIIPTFVTILILYLMNKIEINSNLIIVMFVLVSYATIGFFDDFLKIKRQNNKGLSEIQKLIGQIIIAAVFFYIFIKSGSKPLFSVTMFNIQLNLGWFYAVFILFMLVGSANAVNITDGLDGLATGLSIIATVCIGIITWATYWLTGYQDIALFCFILTGSLIGFMVFNSYPAKVFMGDTGSLAIGGVLASIAIISRHELTFIVIMGVFILETLSVIIQIASIKLFHKKVFLFAPIHHHFEKLGWHELDIVKLFWIIGFMCGGAAIVYGAWI